MLGFTKKEIGEVFRDSMQEMADASAEAAKYRSQNMTRISEDLLERVQGMREVASGLGLNCYCEWASWSENYSCKCIAKRRKPMRVRARR